MVTGFGFLVSGFLFRVPTFDFNLKLRLKPDLDFDPNLRLSHYRFSDWRIGWRNETVGAKFPEALQNAMRAAGTPLGTMPRGDGICLRPQKSAPCPTRQWLHVPCFSSTSDTARHNQQYISRTFLLFSFCLLDISCRFFRHQRFPVRSDLQSRRVKAKRL